MNLFKPSRHEQFLEKELELVRTEHRLEIERVKNTYQMLLESAIEENRRLRDDNARLTRAAVPDVQKVVLPGDPPPAPPPVMPPAKPRTFLELVQQEIASWDPKERHQYIGVPGQPTVPVPDKKPEETKNAGQDGKAA